MILTDRFDSDRALVGMRKLRDDSERQTDAVIHFKDPIAIGTIDCAQNRLQPKDSNDRLIVGFDDVASAARDTYRVATIRHPVGRMIETAVAMTTARRADLGQPPEVRTFAGALVPGGSARL